MNEGRLLPPPEVVVLWEGSQPCVDGPHEGESAVASRYEWLNQLGEVIPTLPRHQTIDFGTLAPGSYTLGFIAREGQSCCNVGGENRWVQITIVSDPAISCAAARALGRGDQPPDPADPTEPSCQVVCLDCQPDLAEWICDRTGHPNPALPYDFEPNGVALFVPDDGSPAFWHLAYSHLFDFTFHGLPAGHGRRGSEILVGYNETRIVSAAPGLRVITLPKRHSKHAELPYYWPYESGDAIGGRDCGTHFPTPSCDVLGIADTYNIESILIAPDWIWDNVTSYTGANGLKWIIEIEATFQHQTIWVDREPIVVQVPLPGGSTTTILGGQGGVQVGGPFGPSTITHRYWYDFDSSGALVDMNYLPPVLTGLVGNANQPLGRE